VAYLPSHVSNVIRRSTATVLPSSQSLRELRMLQTAAIAKRFSGSSSQHCWSRSWVVFGTLVYLLRCGLSTAPLQLFISCSHTSKLQGWWLYGIECSPLPSSIYIMLEMLTNVKFGNARTCSIVIEKPKTSDSKVSLINPSSSLACLSTSGAQYQGFLSPSWAVVNPNMDSRLLSPKSIIWAQPSSSTMMLS
jgi:hypothetical protein